MPEGESIKEFPSYVERSSSSRKPMLVFVFVILLLLILAILGGYFFLNGSKNNNLFSFGKPTPTPTLAPTATPSPTEVASPSGKVTPKPSGKTTPTPSGKVTPAPSGAVSRSKLSVAVLNGSGTPGAAKGTSDYLTGLGYTVASTGNANNFDYTGITIVTKKAFASYQAQLKKDVAANSPSAKITTKTDDTITTDAQVIVGK